MYICKFFKIHELVSPEILNSLGEQKCWDNIPDIVKFQLDQFREEFYTAHKQTLRINDYGFGGSRKYSGVRPVDCPIGASKSKHKEWTTFDLQTWDIEEIESLHEFVESMGDFFNIVRIEKFEHTPLWVHLEFGEEWCDKAYWFNP